MAEPWSEEAIERAVRLRESRVDIAKAKAEAIAAERKKRLTGVEAQREENDNKMPWGAKIGDAVRSGLSGIGRGVASIPGSFSDIIALGEHARDRTDAWRSGRPLPEVQGENRAAREQSNFMTPSRLEATGGNAFIDYAQAVLPDGTLNYEPKTSLGEGVRTVGEFVGGAAAGGPVKGAIGRTIRQGVAPGVAVAGAQAAGVDNPLLLAGVGGVAGAAMTPHSPEAIMRERMKNVTPDQLARTEQLFTEAQAAGVPVSRANILDYVTQGGSNLSDLQRVIEGAGGMRDFYQGSNQGAVAATEHAGKLPTGPLDNPVDPVNPSTFGRRAGEHMNQEMTAVEQGINRQTRPQYQAFENEIVPIQQANAAMQNPLFNKEYQRIFGKIDPQTGLPDPATADPKLAHLTSQMHPESVQAFDLVTREMNTGRENYLKPTSTTHNPTFAEGYRQAGELSQDAASAGSRQAIGPHTNNPQFPSPLEVVQREQAQLREQKLAPLKDGPEGKIAEAATSKDATGAAQEAMFPSRPGAGEPDEVRRAMKTLTKRDPNLAYDFARHWMSTKLAQATQPTQAGTTYYAPTKLWQSVAGNPEQSRAFEAVLSELPSGAQRVRAWQTFQDMAKAMGHRQRIGSNTAFNAKDFEEMKKAGVGEAIAKTIAGGGLKLPEKIWDFMEGVRLGNNMDQIATLFTDPKMAKQFAALAQAPTRSAQMTNLLFRMIDSLPIGQAIAKGSMQSEETPPNEPLTFSVSPRK